MLCRSVWRPLLVIIELEHLQPKQNMALLVVIDRRGRYKSMICSARGQCQFLEEFFAICDMLLAHVLTNYPDT